MADSNGILRRFSGRRTAFLTRLGNIIIVQVVFVFLALTLVLFFPEPRLSVDSEYLFMREKLRQAGGQITALLGQGDARQGNGTLDPAVGQRLNEVLDIDDVVQSFIFLRAGDGSLTRLHSTPQSGPLFADGETEVSAAQLIDLSIIERHAGLEKELLTPIIFSSRYFVYYYRVDTAPHLPLVLVAISDHREGAWGGEGVRYTFLLLFLASALVSLLTVHLINRRFQRPLERLTRGFEKTVSGELYCLVESDLDNELQQLTSAYNNMSLTMWENQQSMKDSNRRLENTNEALRESQEFLGTLIDSSPICIVSTSADGEIVIFNREAQQVFGLQRRDAVGKKFDDLFTHRLSEIKTVKAIMSDNHSMEVLCRRGDGSLFPAYLISVPVNTRGGGVWAYLHLIKDISESKNFQEMMVRLDRYYTRGEMAGDIAHEINNFLAILSGNVELMPILLRGGDREKIDGKLQVMRRTIDRITRFTDGLMDSHEDGGEFETADLNQLIETVVAFLKPQNRFDNIEIRTELSTDIPLVDVDTGQIQQLLVNLLRNASEALDELPSDRRVTIRTALADGEGARPVRVEVLDNGPGVREDKRELLFARRFTTKPKGHGIGLITCKRIIDRHGGSIGYEYADGALFYFHVPVRKRASKKSDEHVSPAETSAAPA
ncbi:MAG: PAS domain S-box protein [Candidatus Zixiibacteriota bacterium]|nr:MAG: PAS domain S-box protein [candidate division Zixibacteria bacterium]